MKLLVLATDYPTKDRVYTLNYIHVRNKYYLSQGIDVTVLNFLANANYVIDGIKVVTLNYYTEVLKNNKYDILVCHAPNLRNHYTFLRKNECKFNKIVFFLHGHEVLMINKVYPKKYYYMRKDNRISIFLQDIYDSIKLLVWKWYFTKIAYKSYFIFVSKWMYSEFLKWVNLDENIMKGRMSITYNSVDNLYELYDYTFNVEEKQFDFITIRSVLDGSKYCIDLICKLAKRYPNYKFLVIGRGKFFEYNEKPHNLEWIDKHLTHKDIIKYLEKSRCGLMLTRTDAQGLMSCEMATYGIPLITSDIDVCHEIFDEFGNVSYISNDLTDVDLEKVLFNLEVKYKFKKNTKYFLDSTCSTEIDIYKKIVQ